MSMKFTLPAPVDRKVPKFGPAYRELLTLVSRVSVRLSRMDRWRGSWSWDYFQDQKSRWADDEYRMLQIFERCWPELLDELLFRQADRAEVAHLCEESAANEVHYLTGIDPRDPRDPSGTLPQ